MTGICFFYEDEDTDVWSGKDFDAWNYACKVAGDIDSAIIINKTTQVFTPFDVSMNIRTVADLAQAQDSMTGTIMYLVMPWDTGNHISLAGHDHDVDWYVFGPAAGWAGLVASGVYIPQDFNGTQYAVHSVHAATHVMFDRYRALHP